MVSSVLASVLQSYLGQYLELSDTNISVGSEVSLNNVQLKESALSDLGLPVKCVHGKVAKLVIKIPWFNLFTKKTTIDVEGLHFLVVPSTAVKYDEVKEKKLQLEAKQKRLDRIEKAKKIEAESKKSAAVGGAGGGDTFVERLVANIIKNVEVNVRKVHVRYEDKQTNTGRYPFAAGVTLEQLLISTRDEMDETDGSLKLKIFEKLVVLKSLAVYWRPKANLYSEDLRAKDEVVDQMFDTNIGTREHPISKMKYLLGPITSEALLRWCPNPMGFNYTIPQVDLSIKMEELCLSLTKYQYQDFMMLLQSFEFMTRASKFRRYKARYELEGLPNYVGHSRQLWKYAFDCIYEEEVMRRINNWSWAHMKAHRDRCRRYRELYIQKLSAAHPSKQVLSDIAKLEAILDEVNIRIQRQLAEHEMEKEQREKKAKQSSGGGWFSWFTGSGSAEGGAQESTIGNNLKKFEEALTSEEKNQLYEVIDYQENAHLGVFPKSFVARKLAFQLDKLLVTVRDDDLNDRTVLKLELYSVLCHTAQRPSADYLQLDMTMQSLTVTGLRYEDGTKPTLVLTRPGMSQDDRLLNLSFENNPPGEPDGDLDSDVGSIYDQRIKFFSSPLEIVYDSRTFYRLMAIFRPPDELSLDNLQQATFSKLKEYQRSTTLGLQYVIDNHNLVDVDVHLMSSYIILPHQGRLTKSCHCAIANLGSIKIQSRPLSVETRSLMEMSLADLTDTFKRNLRDQAYDKFSITLENMQLIVALAGEKWRSHVDCDVSPLFLLSPTSLRINLHYCLIKNDPDLPVTKVNGHLDAISVNISDYRLIKLAQILDTLLDPPDESFQLHRSESDASMISALSSLANTGSLIQPAGMAESVPDIALLRKKSDLMDASSTHPLEHMTKLVLNFRIGEINLSLTQQEKHSNADQKLFHFTLNKMQANATVRTFDITGTFNIGGLSCEHLLVKTPSQLPVYILNTNFAEMRHSPDLLQLTYTDVNKSSPDFVSVHKSVHKKLDLSLSSVHINLHQDAILDLTEKILKFVNEISSKAKNLIPVTAGEPAKEREEAAASTAPRSRLESTGADDEPAEASLKRQNASRKMNKRMSFATSAGLSRWAFRAKKKSLSLQQEEVDLMVTAKLAGVSFDFMTSRVHFAYARVRDLQANYVQTKAEKVITAKLIDFQIHDSTIEKGSPDNCYERIAESMDDNVFDARITLYDNTPELKASGPDIVDVRVDAKMGRVKVVFLMKFVNDFLAFLDPFTGAKEMIAETANNALEGATKSMIDAYANATRAQLNIQMDAPLIIIPVHSQSKTTFVADLGTLTLSNRFALENGNVFDDMHFMLRDLKLLRAKIHDEPANNEVIANCLIIQPITFELDIKRNMSGAKKESDPPELLVTGTLYQINVEMSKDDYNVIMATLQNNFSEKGALDKTQPAAPIGGSSLTLPVKTKYGGSRASLSSQRSIQSLRTAMKVPERDPKAKAVEFSFKFLGFKADIFTGETPLQKMNEVRPVDKALARLSVKVLSVKGYLLVNSEILARAYLENCVIDDSRQRESANGNRITRLLEAKEQDQESKDRIRMIDVEFKQEDTGNQTVEITIHSFVLVGSLPYLLEIANFFMVDQKMNYEWTRERTAVEAVNQTKMSVYVKINEPDILLVEDIDDVNTDALMLNTEVQFKFWSASDSMSMMATLSNIRCHTCRFSPAHREETMAQILQPCTLSFTVSQNEGHGMRINMNMSDLCLNVSPHSINIIMNSVQAFLNSMSENATERKVTVTDEDLSQLWLTKSYKNDDFWFLRDEDPLEAIESLDTFSCNPGLISDEQAIININNLVVKVESGVGTNTIPLLLLESSINCDVKNWSSSAMSAMGSMNVEMAYYNSKLALWEPVLEPVMHEKKDGGSVTKRWSMNITLQSNSAHDVGSAVVSPSYDEADGIICPEVLPPLMAISLESRDMLEMTVTKTFIGVLNTLNQSFIEMNESSKKDLPVAPFIIRNHTGKNVTLMLENRGFKFFVKDADPSVAVKSNQLELQQNADVYLFLYKDRAQETIQYVSPLQEQTEQAEASLRCRLSGEAGTFELPVSKADKRFFPFHFRGDEMGDNHGMVSEITVDNGCKFITLRSIIQIKNHFNCPINVFVFDGESKYLRLANLRPDQTFDVPIPNVYAAPYEFYFQIEGEGQNMGLSCYEWRQLINQPQYSERIQCTNRNGKPDIFLNVDGLKEEIFLEKSGKLTSVCYVIDIRPLLVFKNCLPMTLHYSLGGVSSNSTDMAFVEPGQTVNIQGVHFGYSYAHLKLFEFRGTDWECRQLIESRMPELGSWRFLSADTQAKLDLGINTTISHGTQVVSIYSPFWMVNKTGKMLTYKGEDPQNLIYHPVELQEVPLMFSYANKGFLGKRNASIRIEESTWSDSFTLDTIEDAGKLTCKRVANVGSNGARKKASSQKQPYYVGVNINMSKSSLTKVITFTPYYLVLNTARFPISIRELDGDEFMSVQPNECLPLWPEYSAEHMIACVTGTNEMTPVFSLQHAHSTLLMIGNNYGAIHVECRTSNSETLLTLSAYSKGLAPVQLINNTESCMIEFGEKGTEGQQYLAPSETTYYTWLNPEGSKTLTWSLSGYREEYCNTLMSDGEGIIELEDSKYLAWVSFLDGMQRILLFTEDPGLCYSLAHSTGENERIEQQIDLCLVGIGISIVNNSPKSCYELIYTSISCSNIVWEVRRTGKSRYKSLNGSQCEALEADFLSYMREKSIGKRTSDERVIKLDNSKSSLLVNYAESRMHQPYEGRLRRQYQRGLWVQLRTSAHQRQIHAKINHVQVDNQMRECLFPVIMAPVPPPKSVLADSIPKPFIELSVLEYMSPEHTNLRQYKYLHALVQELHIKIDQGLINALMDLFEEEEILDEDINEFLKEDLSLARKPLKDIAKLQVTEGQKDFYDYLHLSPLKVHVSFSLTSYKSSKAAATRRSNFFGLFLQSLGVTITDTDDIIFRLAYFERKHQFYSQDDLVNEMVRHYTSQAIKQAYVIIFGLDVIGNPFGLVVGVSRSVEDLFYEPFQGAVEGPSEFAEGLVIGVRSVFSGVVGGAAGTVSRITGALGKGLASLTFDEKFQNKRREAIKKRARQTFGESVARSGKGLVMGIFDGVTGVATKPIEGAKEEGVGGFFKGVGKGVVGLVARPTGGLVDFASGTFDSVKRVTEVTEEISRKRFARFIHPDGIVRNYNKKEAFGNKVLQDLEKGRYADTDVYVAHELIESDFQSILLITNKHIIFVIFHTVMGTWNTEWEFEYGAITGPPSVEDDRDRGWSLLIKPKEEKRKVLGLFGGSESGKRIFLSSRDVARNLARIIEKIRTRST